MTARQAFTVGVLVGAAITAACAAFLGWLARRRPARADRLVILAVGHDPR
jgi:ABC-type Fe3+ transport system permease subunit